MQRRVFSSRLVAFSGFAYQECCFLGVFVLHRLLFLAGTRAANSLGCTWHQVVGAGIHTPRLALDLQNFMTVQSAVKCVHSIVKDS